MPTYEYRCPNAHEFERFYRSISTAQGEVACPACGAVAERRMSAGAGLLFKGSGFYITDYGKDGKKDQQRPAAKPDAPEKPDTAGKSEKSEKASANGAAAAPAAGDSGAAAKPAGESKPAAQAKPPAAPKSTGPSE